MDKIRYIRGKAWNLRDRPIIISLISLLFAFVLSGLIIWMAGYSPTEAYSTMFRGAFGDLGKLADTLGTATPLIFTGLAVALAIRGGELNVGCEGQLYLGAIAAAVVGAYVNGLPAPVHIALCCAAAMLAGGLWAVLAGAIKIRVHISEVIVTIMLNYIAIYITDYLVTYMFKAEGMVVKTPDVQPTALLAQLYPRSRLTIGFLFAVPMVFLVWWFLRKTVLGYEMRALGYNPIAAETGGIRKNRMTLITMFLSGALAGMAGAVEVLGVHHYFIQGFSSGYGWDGLAIAVLGQYNPFGVLLGGTLYGALRSGATMMDRMTKLPSDFVEIMQALVIMFVATPAIARACLPKKKVREKEGADDGNK